MSALLMLSLVAGTVVSTIKWFESDRNARTATKLADDLRSSRNRMRDSVDRFQRRVFADEAVYLQMSSGLRSELFGDVIDYLDEFAVYDDNSGESTAATDQPDDLIRQYLDVAEAAYKVADDEQAFAAADRALKRARRLTDGFQSEASEVWNPTVHRGPDCVP